MKDDVLVELLALAESAYPQECCGIVVSLPDKRLKVIPCPNIDPEPTKAFTFDSLWLKKAEEEGEIAYIYHSHPDGSPALSPEDIIQCEELGYPFFVVSYPGKAWTTYRPQGMHTELIGRPFIYGMYDCWTLTRDYYAQKLGVHFPPVEYKSFGWWHEENNENFYLDGLKDLGFVVVSDLKPDDLLLMQVMSKNPNHLAIFQGDGFMLHHLSERKSELAVYGGAWEKATRIIFRHKNLL